MGEWDYVKIESLCDVITKKGRKNSCLPCINMNNIDAGSGQLLGVAETDIKSDKIAFSEDDILFGKLRPYLKKYWRARFDGVCTSEFLVFRAKPCMQGRYLYYVVSNDAFVAFNNSQAFGTKMPRTSWGIAKKYEIAFPKDEKEQEKIVEVLTTMDIVIEKTRALIEKHKNIKAGLMQDLLTNGIDEHGNIRSPKTHEYKPSPLGMIPVEWECVDLFDWSTQQSDSIVDGPFGSNLKSIHYREQGVPVIQSGFVTSGEFFMDRYVYVNESKFREQYRCRANPLDIIVAKIGAHCGKCAVLPENHPQSIIAGNCIKISVGKKNNPFLLQEILSACYDKGDLDLIKATTAQPAISLTKLKKMKIIYISPAEQQEIYIRANAVKKKIQYEQAYLTKLLNIKQGLMQDLLTHKVPVDALL
jgi:type I restriction enzyme S subunit